MPPRFGLRLAACALSVSSLAGLTSTSCREAPTGDLLKNRSRPPEPDDPEEPDETDLPKPDRPELLLASPFLAYGGHDRAALWLAPAERDAALHVLVSPKDAPGSAVRFDVPPRAAAEAESRTVSLDGLLEHTAYTYRIVAGEQPVTRGAFRTGPRPGSPVRATIALASCMNPDLFPRQLAWNVIAAEEPDLLVHLGDNTYGVVSVRPIRSREKHMLQRRVPEYGRALRQVASLAVWDDHDFAGNNSDSTTGQRDATLALFRELFPNPAAGTDQTPGVFFSASLGDVDLFLLDGRYHRSKDSDVDAPAKELLGDAQFEWLKAKLLASTATFKLVGVGSALERGQEGWTLFTHARERLVALTLEVPGIVFLTGDIHHSEFHRWPSGAFGPSGYDVVEVTSSGLAIRSPHHAFATLHVDTTRPDPEIGVRLFKLTSGSEDIVAREEFTIRRSELEPTRPD